MNNLTNFVLAAHSFGGYVCGLYASRYYKHIKKLLMLSPFGVGK
jgi:pimeloyl-ACP methyl ester carboxylesterase